MKEMVFEWLICILCASVLMIIHEMVKTAIYLLQKRRMHQKTAFSHSMWAVYRYIDPIGLILAVVGNVPFSKPFMFRVRDKKTNLVMGISGFCILVAVFALCICSLHFDLFGLDSILQQDPNCLWAKGVVLAGQYMAILSFGMFVANLFPVSVFDMGLIVAGISAKKYLQIIKRDAVIKMLLIVVLLLNLIAQAGYRLLDVLV